MPEGLEESLTKSLPSFIMANFLKPNVKDRVALVCGGSGETRTFGELHNNTHKFAHSLMDMGIGKGDCVGIISPNNINFFSAFQGIGLTGATSTPINPLYTEHEIEYQLSTTHAKLLIAHPICYEKAKNVAKKLGIPLVVLDHMDGVEEKTLMNCVREQSKDDEVKVDVDPEAIVTLPFSSGTTGKYNSKCFLQINLAAFQVYRKVLL